MNREQMLLALKLKDRYKALMNELKVCNDHERYLAVSAEMASVRAERAALEPKRPVGRPRVRPVGVPRNFAKGTPSQQARARGLRKRRDAAQQELAAVQAEFDELAAHGGPSR
jgi:hypothetical protein